MQVPITASDLVAPNAGLRVWDLDETLDHGSLRRGRQQAVRRRWRALQTRDKPELLAFLLYIPTTPNRRNTHIFSSTGGYLGGLWLADPSFITRQMFYDLTGRIIRLPRPNQRFRIYHLNENNSTGVLLRNDHDEVRPGRYVIMSSTGRDVPATITSEQSDRRVPSTDSSRDQRTNQRHFRDGLQARDEHCVITGRGGRQGRPMEGLAASHIYPVAQLGNWMQQGHEQWITDDTDAHRIGPNRMFSLQNGLLLEAGVHAAFDGFSFSINPDKGYRVVCFVEDTLGVSGRILSPTTRNCDRNSRVSDECLRWHYHQAVLTYTRVAGELVWDLGDHHEMGDMEALMAREDAAEALEAEFAMRLMPYVEAK
ncbi:hypothetical protein BJY01DRAFT_256865 [Aspergillus pseudoustus]|uniref:HNH nuclease domain-containing protein n=1 Tax=Aspergillus pseudoustus TaxID=1810923 RepID=A0ABR4JQH1_9EURO